MGSPPLPPGKEYWYEIQAEDAFGRLRTQSVFPLPGETAESTLRRANDLLKHLHAKHHIREALRHVRSAPTNQTPEAPPSLGGLTSPR